MMKREHAAVRASAIEPAREPAGSDTRREDVQLSDDELERVVGGLARPWSAAAVDDWAGDPTRLR